MKTTDKTRPDDVWKEARIEAAKHNTSLSGLVRGKAPILVGEPAEVSDRQSRETLFAALQSTDLVLGYQPSREKTYEP